MLYHLILEGSEVNYQNYSAHPPTKFSVQLGVMKGQKVSSKTLEQGFKQNSKKCISCFLIMEAVHIHYKC